MRADPSDTTQGTLTGNLTLQFVGADDVAAADLQRAVDAAMDVLRSHGVSPAEADHGRWRRDLCEALGLADDLAALSRRDSLAAWAWDEATRAACLATGLADAQWRLVEEAARIAPRIVEIDS